MYKISKILVPVDFSSCSRAALEHALSLSSVHGASVEVLTVAEVPVFRQEPKVSGDGGATTLREFAERSAKAELDAFLAGVPAEQRSKLATSVDVGRPREVILERAKRGGVDLLVVGTHGRTGRAHSLAGSVAESLVRSSSCPVLTVREP
jgi:nucleotide-binding universal stress UspA family protein